jgi:hypothetical protein
LSAALALSAITVTPVSLAAPPTEYEVKAVFLYNFSQFVSWPASAFDSPSAPFVIGVLGRDPFGAALESAVNGEHNGSHPIVTRRISNLADLAACHIVFIERSEFTRLGPILQALHGHNTLTVSDAERAAQRGVMIDFVTTDHHLRLQINLPAVEASGLSVSSKLLRPAEIVATEGG